jgi:predicted DNA-binding transcriptional regulator AlpA
MTMKDRPLTARQIAEGIVARQSAAEGNISLAAFLQAVSDGRKLPIPVDDRLLTSREAAAEASLSLAAFWKSVSDRRLPAPLYPASRCPRWRLSELRAALAATRMWPAQAKQVRRAARNSH